MRCACTDTHRSPSPAWSACAQSALAPESYVCQEEAPEAQYTDTDSNHHNNIDSNSNARAWPGTRTTRLQQLLRRPDTCPIQRRTICLLNSFWEHLLPWLGALQTPHPPGSRAGPRPDQDRDRIRTRTRTETGSGASSSPRRVAACREPPCSTHSPLQEPARERKRRDRMSHHAAPVVVVPMPARADTLPPPAADRAQPCPPRPHAPRRVRWSS